MVWTPKFDFAVDQETAMKSMQFPIGAASPLWFAYAGMAGLGVGYWWMSQFAKPVNLEAFRDFAPKFDAFLPARTVEAMTPEPAVVEAAVDAFVAPIEETQEVVAEMIEAAPAPSEAIAEAAEPVIETVAAVQNAAVETAAAMVEQVEEVTATVIDDLTKLVGIGPKLSERLAEMGVTKFSEIASWTTDDIAKFDAALDLKGRAVREAWIAQAKRYAEDSPSSLAP